MRLKSRWKTILRIKKQYLKIRREILLPILTLGISPFVMMSTESLLSLCFNTSLLKYGGDLAVGAMTILASVMQFAMLPLQGLTQGMQPIVSFNYGAKKNDRVKEGIRFNTLVGFLYTLIAWICIFIFPKFSIAFLLSPSLEFEALKR